jgi:superfamily II DNA helicase RecQ
MHKVRDGRYQIVYVFPEMLRPDNTEFWKVVMAPSSKFSKRLLAVVIDEVQCIYNWGRMNLETGVPAFRPEYGNIGNLRSV